MTYELANEDAKSIAKSNISHKVSDFDDELRCELLGSEGSDDSLDSLQKHGLSASPSQTDPNLHRKQQQNSGPIEE